MVERRLQCTDEVEKGSTHAHRLGGVMVVRDGGSRSATWCNGVLPSCAVGGGRLTKLDVQRPVVLRTQRRRNCTNGTRTKISHDKRNYLIRKDIFRFKKKANVLESVVR